MLVEMLSIAVVVYVFVILTSPGMIFYFWYKLIDKIKYDWLFKPLGGCNLCTAGQASLWFYLIKYFHSYNFLEHIVFISGTILIVMILDKLIDYEVDDN
jgi:hypothetical protein